MSDSTGQTSATPQITEEMIEAGAMALDERIPPGQHAPTGRAFMRLQAAAVLKAALAGRTVVELPEPEPGLSPGGDTRWTAQGSQRRVTLTAYVDDDGEPFVEDEHGATRADDAERYALAKLAAARWASRKWASESSGDSDPCCDLHGVHCEPPSELCRLDCTEARHPEHPAGVACVLDAQGGQS